MNVVPLSGDNIETTDGGLYTVVSYTNYKPKGPAVYVTVQGAEQTSATPVIYFFDIQKIQDVHVEFDNSSKTFKAAGKIKRLYHLPQVNDKISILKDDTPADKDNDVIKVEKLKLHNKSEGISKGLLICGEDTCYMLDDILAIDRVIGSDSFDRRKFLKLYKDYTGSYK